MAGFTSNQIANMAVNLIGNKIPPITGNAPTFDTSAAGKACAVLYAETVQAAGREFGFDFARATVTLGLSGNAAPVPWAFEYLYPPAAIQIWQLMPAVIADPNNPVPQRWDRGNAQVGGTQTAVIWSNLANAVAYLNNNPSEAVWDALFAETVSRFLASKLAMALAGRPETAGQLITTAGTFLQRSELRGS